MVLVVRSFRPGRAGLAARSGQEELAWRAGTAPRPPGPGGGGGGGPGEPASRPGPGAHVTGGGGQREPRLRRVITFRPPVWNAGPATLGFGRMALPPHTDREDDAVPRGTLPSGIGGRPRRHRPGRGPGQAAGRQARQGPGQRCSPRAGHRGSRQAGRGPGQLGLLRATLLRPAAAAAGLALLAACSAPGPGQSGSAGGSGTAGSRAAHPAAPAGSSAGSPRTEPAGPRILQVSPAPYQLPSGLAREVVLPAGPDLLLAGGLTPQSTSTAAVLRLNPSNGQHHGDGAPYPPHA